MYSYEDRVRAVDDVVVRQDVAVLADDGARAWGLARCAIVSAVLALRVRLPADVLRADVDDRGAVSRDDVREVGCAGARAGLDRRRAGARIDDL